MNGLKWWEYFTVGGWAYLFWPQISYYRRPRPGFLHYWDHRPTILMVLCRARGHPGTVFYNPGGTEPDYHCTRCGEDLA